MDRYIDNLQEICKNSFHLSKYKKKFPGILMRFLLNNIYHYKCMIHTYEQFDLIEILHYILHKCLPQSISYNFANKDYKYYLLILNNTHQNKLNTSQMHHTICNLRYHKLSKLDSLDSPDYYHQANIRNLEMLQQSSNYRSSKEALFLY